MPRKTKKCKKCNRRKPLSDFKPLRNSPLYKTEEFNICEKCRLEQNQRYRDSRMNKDLAYALLMDSCKNAFKRGQEKYKERGYEKVTTSFKSIKGMAEFLSNDPEFYEEWKRQTQIYDEAGRPLNLRPSLHRPDTARGYEPYNIVCAPYGEQVSLAASRSVYAVVIESMRFTKVLWFQNKRTALQELKIPSAVMKNSIDFGIVVDGSEGKKYILQSSDVTESRKQPNIGTDPKYLLIVNALFKNLVTNEDVMGQMQFRMPGLFFNIEKQK